MNFKNLPLPFLSLENKTSDLCEGANSRGGGTLAFLSKEILIHKSYQMNKVPKLTDFSFMVIKFSGAAVFLSPTVISIRYITYLE